MKRVLKFGAEWCNACKVLDENLNDAKTDVPIERIDIDQNSHVSSEFGIKSIPTMIMLDGNTEMKRFVGNKTAKEIEDWVNG